MVSSTKQTMTPSIHPVGTKLLCQLNSSCDIETYIVLEWNEDSSKVKMSSDGSPTDWWTSADAFESVKISDVKDALITN